MVAANEALEIAELIFFGPALLLAVFICTKHGFKREAGWFLLVVLSLIRIIGASCGIAATKNNDKGLIEASLITSSIGSATLVAAFTGIINRIAQGSKGSPFSPRQRKLIQLLGIASIVLGIMGGTNINDDDPSSREHGQTYLKVAVILILIQLLVSIAVLAYSARRVRDVLNADRKLLYCAYLAIPFLFVRILYSMLAAFDTKSSTFSLLSTTTLAVVLRACPDIAMEIVVVSLFLIAGVLSPPMAEDQKMTSAKEGASLIAGMETRCSPNPGAHYPDKTHSQQRN